MPQHITRRDMLRRSTLAGVTLWLGARSQGVASYAANEKLNVACIGVGGRGRANVNGLARESLVALCDVDDERAGDAYRKFPQAKKYFDFRRMFDDMHKEIDGVVVSTPDHTHFHPSIMALELGKHLYCEKPLAHSVEEVRKMTDLAAKKKLATQLGAQRHTHDNMHRVVELVQAGVIGDVSECHAWVGGNRGMPGIPTVFPEVPSHLKYDLWLGPAAGRPYSPEYVPYKWRFWWDFGTGETGNWGCHVLDIPFWALKLKHPVRVEGSGPPVHPQMTPKSMETCIDFPARGDLPPVKLYWYHTKEGPSILREHNLRHPGTGVLFVGSKGMLLCDFGQRWLYPEKKFADLEPPPKTIPDSPGFHKEWVIACKGGEPATVNFDYSGPMAETVLLANLAYRCGKAFDWDARNLKAVGAPEAEQYIRTKYRKGWEV